MILLIYLSFNMVIIYLSVIDLVTLCLQYVDMVPKYLYVNLVLICLYSNMVTMSASWCVEKFFCIDLVPICLYVEIWWQYICVQFDIKQQICMLIYDKNLSVFCYIW